MVLIPFMYGGVLGEGEAFASRPYCSALVEVSIRGNYGGHLYNTY
jgi:hypothetical protein